MSNDVVPIIRGDGGVVIPIYDASPTKVAFMTQEDKDKLDSISPSAIQTLETVVGTSDMVYGGNGTVITDGESIAVNLVNLESELQDSLTFIIGVLDSSFEASGVPIDYGEGVGFEPDYIAPHQHEITDVNGLENSLNSKQPSGDYSVVGHTHSTSAIDGLQLSLDSKQPSGDYALEVHTHPTSAIDGLQFVLDSKQPSGDYALEVHTHPISGVDGLQESLDSKQPSGDYLNKDIGFVEKSVSFNTSEVTGSGLVVRAVSALTITFDDVATRTQGTQFAVMAIGGNVIFVGSGANAFIGAGGNDELAMGNVAWIVYDGTYPKVYGVTL